MNQARSRTAGNTLLMRVASKLYIKMAAPGWPFSCNTKIKVTLAELASPAHVIRPLLWVVLSLHAICTWKLGNLPLSWFVYRVFKNICHACSFPREDVGPCRLYGLNVKECNLVSPEIILLNKIVRNHLLSENLQWNYASFNATFIYLTHDGGILLDIFFDSRQLRVKYCQTLGNKPHPSIPIIFGSFTFKFLKNRLASR